MSKIALTPNATGTGVFTISSPKTTVMAVAITLLHGTTLRLPARLRSN
jgi:hypothetical protein